MLIIEYLVPMTDYVSAVLSTLSIQSALYFKETFHKPWGMSIEKGPYSQFHLLTRGQCLLSSPYLASPITLEAGDLILCVRGAAHKLMDAGAISCLSGLNVVTSIEKGENPFPGNDPGATLVCGHFELTSNIRHPLLGQLPDVLVLSSHEYRKHQTIPTLIDLILDEQNQDLPGSSIISNGLAELLFTAVIRHYYLKVDQRLNLISDPQIYQALNLMHAEPPQDLTIQEIAQAVGISRTLFVQRFKKAVGETPIKYLSQWRLALASKLLCEQDMMIDEVASAVGYQSETAFNRAFTKSYKLSPGRYRKRYAIA